MNRLMLICFATLPLVAAGQVTDQERITALEARVEQLDERIEYLEQVLDYYSALISSYSEDVQSALDDLFEDTNALMYQSCTGILSNVEGRPPEECETLIGASRPYQAVRVRDSLPRNAQEAAKRAAIVRCSKISTPEACESLYEAGALDSLTQ